MSPIPHLPPSTTVRRRPRAGDGRAFRTSLAGAIAASRGSWAVERDRRGASTPGRNRPLPSSLLRFERPKVYRYVANPGGQAAGTAAPTQAAERSETSGSARKTHGAQVKEDAKVTLLRRIHAFARRLGVDPALSEAIARAESGLDQDARSPDGKTEGAFQIKPMTAAAMQQRLADDPARLPLSDEVTLGIGYLRYLDRLFATRAVLDDPTRTTTPISNDSERRRFAIAAYNAGEGRVAAAQQAVRSAGGDPSRFEEVRPFLPPVTRRYVDRVLSFADKKSGSVCPPAVGTVN